MTLNELKIQLELARAGRQETHNKTVKETAKLGEYVDNLAFGRSLGTIDAYDRIIQAIKRDDIAAIF